MQGFKYDPARAIDLTKKNPQHGFGRFGYIGPHPSRPCDYCGNEYFWGGDWNMGYRCTQCHKPFGTKEEWEWDQ